MGQLLALTPAALCTTALSIGATNIERISDAMAAAPMSEAAVAACTCARVQDVHARSAAQPTRSYQVRSAVQSGRKTRTASVGVPLGNAAGRRAAVLERMRACRSADTMRFRAR